MMLASELQDLVVTKLVRQAGGTARRWRLAVGSVRVYDCATHPGVNWSIEPHGTSHEISTIENLLDEVRLTHPLIDRD
jgi:hypothetical protein